jgi:hypothetical protein
MAKVASKEASSWAQAAQMATWARAAAVFVLAWSAAPTGAEDPNNRSGRADWQVLQFIWVLPFIRRRVV